jgi:hypothetical protein
MGARDKPLDGDGCSVSRKPARLGFIKPRGYMLNLSIIE